MKLPPYDTFPVLKDRNITLRPVQKADISHLLEISFYDSVKAADLEQALGMQYKINADYEAGNSIHWGIADNTTNKITGTCGFYRGFNKRSGELGFVLLSQYRGKGFMTTALSRVIDFGFTYMGLERIWAVTNRQNVNAIKLLERLHFRKVAVSGDEAEYEFTKIELSFLCRDDLAGEL